MPRSDASTAAVTMAAMPAWVDPSRGMYVHMAGSAQAAASSAACSGRMGSRRTWRPSSVTGATGMGSGG